MKVNGPGVSHHSGGKAQCVCIAAVGFQEYDWKGARPLERFGRDATSLPSLSVGQDKFHRQPGFKG